MKSICIITYSEYVTDARVVRHAEAASKDGYAVDVITPTHGREPSAQTINAVNILRLRTRHYSGAERVLYSMHYLDFWIRSFIKVTWLTFRKRYDIVYVCNMPDFLVFSTAMAKLMGAKILLDIHDPMPATYLAKFPGSQQKGLYRFLLWLERLSAAYADRVVTVSEPVKRDILILDGIASHKISVIANFPDADIFKVRDQFAVGHPIKIIYYGTIAPRFDLQGVLSAIAHVRQKDKLIFRIIGKGSAAVPLRETITQLGLERFVKFSDTTYPLKELPNIISQYQLGIAPYLPSSATDYMLPVKLLELLAMGIPSVAPANTAIRYYIDGSMYFAYDPNDLDSLTKTIEDIIENPDILLDKREAILKAREGYVWSRLQTVYLVLLSQLVKRGNNGKS